MTQLSPPGGSGSPERGGFPSTGDNGQELKILHRRIFLSASNFMNSIGSYSVFDNLSLNDIRGGILRRALEVSVLDCVVIERPGQNQTYQERMERKNAEEAIASYIQAYSKDENFVYGFRLIKGFIRELRVFLDGSGGDAKLNQSNMVRIGTTGIEMPAIEIKKHILEDSRGYTLVEYAEDTFLKSYQKGENSPTLKRLAIIHPR